MHQRLVVSALALTSALPLTALAQPTPSPSPASESSPGVSPTASPAASATPYYSAVLPGATIPPTLGATPSYSATLPGLSSPVPGATPTYQALMPGASATPLPNATPSPLDESALPSIQPDLDTSLVNPGAAPLPSSVPMVTRNPEAVTPSKTTIQKANAAFVERIQAFSKSQRNPAVSDITLDQAVNYALRHNPDVLNAIQQIRLTHGQIVEVTSQALPHINAVAGFQQQEETLVNPKQPPSSSSGNTLLIPLPNGGTLPVDFSGGSSGQPFTNPQAWNVGFQASQLIYDGGAVIAGIRSAKFVEDSTYFSLRQLIDQTIANVKTAFYQVVLDRALVVAQQQSVDLLAQQLKDQQSRYEAGTVPRFNVLQAQVALANAQPPLITAENNLRISQYQLVKTIGMDYKPLKPSEVPFNVVGGLPYEPRAINPNESIRIAIQRSPALKAQRQNILAQAENVHVQFAGYLPSISATADYTWQSNPAFHSLSEVTQGWTYGFQGSWAIFDGFNTAGKVQVAKAQLQQAAINYDNQVRQVILNVQQAISNLQTAQQTLTSQEASVTEATEALRLAQERLDAGAGTQLDVLNQQTQLLQAETTVLQARYDYLAAEAAYDLALSLDAQYEETFKDPLTSRENARFHKVTMANAPQPPLPGKLRNQDPISGFSQNAPVPYVAAHKGSAAKPAATPKPKKKFLGIF